MVAEIAKTTEFMAAYHTACIVYHAINLLLTLAAFVTAVLISRRARMAICIRYMYF